MIGYLEAEKIWKNREIQLLLNKLISQLIFNFLGWRLVEK